MARKEITQKNNIVIYTDSRGNVELRADIQKETIWATQDQIADLFGIDRTVVTKHIGNILADKELRRDSVCAKFALTAKDGKQYLTNFYNLDIVLAVGYRTNSIRAIRFRQWATKTLRDYIVKGIAFNATRFKQLPDKMIKDLDEKIRFIQRTIQKRQLDQAEVDSLLSVINDYAHAWTTLKKYDEGDIVIRKSKAKEIQKFNYDFVRPAVDRLASELASKGEASDLFGLERDGSFMGILATVYQTFDGKELYGSLEEKAAHLLYFIIKDHPFSDGNKRIGSFVFVHFLSRNSMLYRKSGEKKINDNTLVALALLIAESDPKDKELMVALTTNLLG